MALLPTSGTADDDDTGWLESPGVSAPESGSMNAALAQETADELVSPFDPSRAGVAPLPDRYELRETDKTRVLLCEEAPRVRVRIDRKFSYSESEARELGERVILLDGAGRFGPMLDNTAKIYNLDHHEGCERLFTLATCEQAMLLVHSGLNLSEGDWTIFANEPDLDTVLAIWVLLNYERVRTLSPAARDVLLPMLRLEGAIDANGSDLAEICGLPQVAFDQANERLEWLMRRERAYKSRGLWGSTDPAEFTADVLREIDALIFSSLDFMEYDRLEEVYGHAEIGGGKVAVVCRDGRGIYEVEQLLKKRWGDQLGIVALEKDRRHYTLRRATPLADFLLQTAYDRLNLLDPAVDGRPAGKCWGGSNEIGGSPRPSGTRLSPQELVDVLGVSYRKIDIWRQLGHLARAFFIALTLCLAGWSSVLYAPDLLPDWHPITAGLVGWGAPVLLGALVLSFVFSKRRFWLYGYRGPAGTDWLALAPLAALGGLPLAGQLPEAFPGSARDFASFVGAVALIAVAAEACFRGLVHGVVILDAPVQRAGGRWFVSRPTVLSAVLYGLAGAIAWLPTVVEGPRVLADVGLELGAVAAATTLGGLALGMMRERSLSIWPGAALVFLGTWVGAMLLRVQWGF